MLPSFADVIVSFNPHSRTGSDHALYVAAAARIVSIHTPARGVTSGVRGAGTVF